jgi:manganese efflux pump family protein
MRRTTAAAAAAAFTLVVLYGGCWAAAGTALAAAGSRAAATGLNGTPEACFAVAVHALRQRIVVRHLPPECRGLGPEQVNETIERAIRTVVGPLPKAAARRGAQADSRYLGALIRPVRPARAASAAFTPATSSATEAARLAALVAWLAAATAGAYLLAGRLTRVGRRIRITGESAWVAGGHAGLAVAGLLIWIAFLVTTSSVLGWIDAVLTWVIAGLGMSTLLADAPSRAGGTAFRSTAFGAATAAGEAVSSVRAPVLTIALHGVLATATLAFVLAAVIGVG